MAKKKNKPAPKQAAKQTLVIQAEDTAQAQEVFTRYHEIAHKVRISFSRDQAEPALNDINNMPEAAQVALLKSLAKERDRDAADLLLGLNELSPLKSIRKEARRALIQLEEARIYPQWKIPANQTSPFQIVDASKHPLMIDPDLHDDDDFDEGDFLNDETEYSIDIHGLSAGDVAAVFIRFWSRRKYRSTYSLLTELGPLRANLSIDQWAALRTSWAEIAKPHDTQIEYVQKLEPQASDSQRFNVSIPDSSTSTRVVEVAWSTILEDIPDNQSVPELPQTLLVYPTTGRHWFWSKYLL